MSTCNRLDLQTLGSEPVMPKSLRDHWWETCCSSWLVGKLLGEVPHTPEASQPATPTDVKMDEKFHLSFVYCFHFYPSSTGSLKHKAIPLRTVDVKVPPWTCRGTSDEKKHARMLAELATSTEFRSTILSVARLMQDSATKSRGHSPHTIQLHDIQYMSCNLLCRKKNGSQIWTMVVLVSWFSMIWDIVVRWFRV